MTDADFLERTKRFAFHLAELQERLTPESYALLLRVLRGINDALTRQPGGISIEFAPGEKELFTAELAQELTRLVEFLGPGGLRVVIDMDGAEGPCADVAEHDRHEVERIARASGLEP
ncbi:hypothetical protein [Wenjunlia tyrosinilytica]|uniref:Uncharacterized protein n=1 Tax=Wenjunlia tyrosinilytica TaxID=1544741 RepID=A0A917ZFU3_9ACTN|nr:hypothetical protein [Wenjunlia tyrosinilytica]GGO81334.1 hypothetical protein GCM10012280_05310 [Wenjunlia tyrosinilytica]